jgi:hypothetical protein
VISFTPRPLYPQEKIGGWVKKNNRINDVKLLFTLSQKILVPVRMGEMRNAYKTLVGKPGRKRTFGKPTLRWEDNIKTDPK